MNTAPTIAKSVLAWVVPGMQSYLAPRISNTVAKPCRVINPLKDLYTMTFIMLVPRLMSNQTVLYRVTLYYITLHCIASHHITSHHTLSQHIMHYTTAITITAAVAGVAVVRSPDILTPVDGLNGTTPYVQTFRY
jgi:hypothetical protein